jgi:hypothetical protein
MKLRPKYTLQIGLTACLLFLLSSCGKDNKVDSGKVAATSPLSTTPAGSSPFYAGNPALSANPQIITQVQNLKSSVACLSGRNRLTYDVSFFINGGAVSGTTIGGSWQSGLLNSNSGIISNLYIGVSAFRDLMFVTKVTNGAQVVGYNVTLSFCEVPNKYANFPALVANGRPLVNFQAPYGIVLDTNTYCGYGVVDAAVNTVIISQRDTTNPYTADYPVYTSFSKPLCNGQF